jgi:competence protein ComEA
MIQKLSDLVLGVLFGLLSAGLILLVARPKERRAVLLRPPPTPAPLVVNIDGAVQVPGVYTLPRGSRVQDAVEVAGGMTDSSSPGAVNLAALLEDGSHLYIPSRSVEAESNQQGTVRGMSPEGELISLVNLNQASLDTLVTLPGIGPVTAEKIINYREEQAFSRIEEIQKVPGIGPATFEQIKKFLTVGE